MKVAELGAKGSIDPGREDGEAPGGLDKRTITLASGI